MQATEEGQIIDLDLGMGLKARMPSRALFETWKSEGGLKSFRADITKRVSGLLRVIPDPESLADKSNWTNQEKKIFYLNFSGNRDDIGGRGRVEFLRESERLGISIPRPVEVRDAYWKPTTSRENVAPKFPYPLEPAFSQLMTSIRTELLGYLDQSEIVAITKPVQVPIASSTIPAADHAALVTALAGERAKGIITEAELQSVRIVTAARAEADDILRSAREQRDALLEEASATLRAALGILSQPTHEKSRRDPASK